MSDKKLKDLNIGDKFYPASKAGKATPIFEVLASPPFISGNRVCRRCKNLQTGSYVNKPLSLEVIKTR